LIETPPVVELEKKGGSRVLRIGIVAELVNLLTLAILNFAGPALLDTERFGLYVRVFGVAFLALGLVDSPLALSLLVRHKGDKVTLAALKKSAISVAVAIPLGLLTLGFGPSFWASVCLCFAHTFGSSSISLNYRNGKPGFVILWYLTVLGALMSTIYAATRFDWQAPTIVFAQSAILFVVAITLLTYALAMTRDRPFEERSVSTSSLGVAAYIGGPLQWLLVLSVGALFGSIAAANVKVGISLMNLPLASVPLSGQLLLAHAQQFSEITAAAIRKRIGIVAVLSSTVSAVVFLAKDLIFNILDLVGGKTVEGLIGFVLIGGVGLAVFSTTWPTIAARLISPSQSKALLVLFVGGSMAVLGLTLVGAFAGLVSLIALYIAAGSIAFVISLVSGKEALSPAAKPA
jgi:lipid-A-disaccharide synthase-like uncharacterized protein